MSTILQESEVKAREEAHVLSVVAKARESELARNRDRILDLQEAISAVRHRIVGLDDAVSPRM